MIYTFLFGENKKKLLKKQINLTKETNKCYKKFCNTKKKIKEINILLKDVKDFTERKQLKLKRDKIKKEHDNNICIFNNCKDIYIKLIKNDIKIYNNYSKKDFGKYELKLLSKLNNLLESEITIKNFNSILIINQKLFDYLNNLNKKKTSFTFTTNTNKS